VAHKHAAVRVEPDFDTTCVWRAAKISTIDQLLLSNPTPSVISLGTCSSNELLLIDERKGFGHSHKAWLVAELLRHHIRSDALKPGIRVILRSSGSTAIMMAEMCARLDIPFAAIVTRTAPDTKKELIRSNGGELIEVEDVKSAYNVEEDHRFRPGDLVIDQFSAEARSFPIKHSPASRMLGALKATRGRMPSVIVAAVGTGTSANSIRLATSDEHVPVEIVGVDVVGGVFQDYRVLGLRAHTTAPHLVEGMSLGFVPPSLMRTSLDRFSSYPQEAAIATCHYLRAKLDLCVGPSSGMAIFGALSEMAAMRHLWDGKLVTSFCYDHGLRYADTIFDPAFLRDKGLDLGPWIDKVEQLHGMLA